MGRYPRRYVINLWRVGYLFTWRPDSSSVKREITLTYREIWLAGEIREGGGPPSGHGGEVGEVMQDQTSVGPIY